MARLAPEESKIRPDHAPESPQRIGSMISPSLFFLPLASLWSRRPMSWFLALVRWCGVDGKQEKGGGRERMRCASDSTRSPRTHGHGGGNDRKRRRKKGKGKILPLLSWPS